MLEKKINFLMSYFIRGLGLISSYIFTYFASNICGMQEWGFFSVTLSITNYFVLFGKMGTDLSLMKYISLLLFNNKTNQIYKLYKRTILFIIMFNFIFLFIFYIFTNAYTSRDFQIKYAILIALPLLTSIINAEVLRGIGKNKSYIFILFTCNYLLSSITLLIFHFFNIKTTPIFAFMIANIITSIISFLMVCAHINKYVRSSCEIDVKSFARSSYHFFLANIWVVFIDWFDIFLLSRYTSVVVAGQYALTLKITNILNLPLMITGSIIANQYTESFVNDNKTQTELIFKKYSFLSTITSLTLLVLFSIFAELVLTLFNCNDENTVRLFRILLIGQFVNTIFGTTDVILQIAGYESTLSYVLFTGCVVGAILNFILIPIYGYFGAAFSLIIVKLIIKFSSLYFISNKIKIKIF